MRVVGLSSSFWYFVYQLKLRSGWLRSCIPARTWEQVYSGTSWTADGRVIHNRSAFFFEDPRSLQNAILRADPFLVETLRPEITDLRRGRFRLWSDSIHALGFPPSWNRNPLTGREQPADAHWTRMEEQATGDVKGLWELSRFSLVFPLVRWYAVTGDEAAPETFWQLAESWLAANPPQQGAQWLSAQEAGLRAMAWIFALRAFEKTEATTPDRARRLLAALGEHGRRIEATLSYARAQNNNHLISEAAALFTIGLQCPQLPGSNHWYRIGRKLLCEATGQFFPDGGYIQHSHNYHRLAVQLYLWSFRLAQLYGDPFPEYVRARVARSLPMMKGMVDPATGCIQNFGNNDGALFFPLNACAYEDYRPLVQALSYFVEGQPVFPPGLWDEDSIWLFGPDSVRGKEPSSPEKSRLQERTTFPDAGLFILKGRESRVIVRCAHFNSRPAHADQLHVDLWIRGENAACDAGSYLYSGEAPWQNSLTHAAVHNTVTVDNHDQMQRSGRFRWSSLAQGTVLHSGEKSWAGTQDGYRSIGVMHRRTVERLGNNGWIVTDDVTGRGTHVCRLHWLMPDYDWRWDASGARGGLIPILPDGERRMQGFAEGAGRCLRLQTPAGEVSLHAWASRPAEWTVYRAGEAVGGEEEHSGPVPTAIRGWRSLRYASKQPAVSLAGSIRAELPVRFTSIWVLME